MRRTFAVTSACVLLLGKSMALAYAALGTASTIHLRLLWQPLLFLAAAIWLYFHPKTARWVVGAFLAYATVKEAIVFPTFTGSSLDVIRRPFSMAVGAWLTWALLFGLNTEKLPQPKSPAVSSPPGAQFPS